MTRRRDDEGTEGVTGEDFELRTKPTQERTHPDGSFGRDGDEHPILIYIGSPENAFADAGLAFPLDEFGRVRFERVPQRGGLEVDGEDTLLHIGIPLPWVSGAHAELSVLRSGDDGYRFHLTDLGSRNGSLLEGRAVDRARVRPGQVFELGRSFWMLRVMSAREAADYGTRTRSLGATANPRLKRLHTALHRLATGDVPVLLWGETGTGKDHLARAMHEASARPGPFVRVNVSALPSDRMEVGSSAAGAELLLRARAGTIYIDEVGELSPGAQQQLLRLVQRAGPPANGEPGPRVDVRIIAATTRDLGLMATRGEFRHDLYASLAAFEAHLPALRERREDLGLIVRELGDCGLATRVTTRAFRKLAGHVWPFNIRELANALHAATAVSDPSDTVTARGLTKILSREEPVTARADVIQSTRERILQLLIRHAGDTEAVARDLARPVSEVVQWLTRFELRASDYTALAGS
jgi:hypothetical protein